MTLHIVQFNFNSSTRKNDKSYNFMRKNGILVAAVQETKLTTKSTLYRKDNHTIIRKDRDRNMGGGVAFIINLPAPSSTDHHIVQHGITIQSGNYSSGSSQYLHLPSG